MEERCREQPTGKIQPGTCAPRGWASFVELKYIPTAHTHAQANLAGKLPNRSPWGVFTPAGDLLHCAFSGLFSSHFPLTQAAPEPEA